MPTPRGLAIAFLFLGILAVGLVRDELGVVVWSGGLLLVEVVVIVVAAVAGARLRAVSTRFATELERPVVEVGEAVGVNASLPALPLLPGLYLEHELPLAWTDRRPLRVSSVVSPGDRSRWTFRARARGDYRCEASRLVLRDVFGFTATTITDERALRLIVLPGELDLEPELPTTRGGEQAAEKSSHRVRSDELREVRPYVPGDDVRRLSWKHLATYRELLTRIGEAIPPSRGEVRCRVDDRVPDGATAVAAGDALMQALRAVTRTADERGLDLVCRIPGAGELRLTLETMGVGVGASEAVDERVAAAVAGFVPGGERSGPTVARRVDGTGGGEPAGRRGADSGRAAGSSPASWLTITAREDVRGPSLSVGRLLEPIRKDRPVWRRLLLREAT
ncbi:MAG: DUF58 domain-containing protein [bacterium]